MCVSLHLLVMIEPGYNTCQLPILQLLGSVSFPSLAKRQNKTPSCKGIYSSTLKKKGSVEPFSDASREHTHTHMQTVCPPGANARIMQRDVIKKSLDFQRRGRDGELRKPPLSRVARMRLIFGGTNHEATLDVQP